MNYATDRQALVKRLIDIAGGFCGLYTDWNHLHICRTRNLHQLLARSFLTDKNRTKRQAI